MKLPHLRREKIFMLPTRHFFLFYNNLICCIIFSFCCSWTSFNVEQTWAIFSSHNSMLSFVKSNGNTLKKEYFLNWIGISWSVKIISYFWGYKNSLQDFAKQKYFENTLITCNILTINCHVTKLSQQHRNNATRHVRLIEIVIH